MTRYTAEEVSHRAGVSVDYLGQLVALRMIEPDENGTFSVGDARRAGSIHAIEHGGVQLEALASGLAYGGTDLSFLDDPVYERLAATTNETFEHVVERTGISFDLLSVVRVSLGWPAPVPDDYIREHELLILPFVQIAAEAGYTDTGIRSLLVVMGDSMRRVAETEGDVYFSEILAPRLAQGSPDIDPELARSLSVEIDAALAATFHAQQGHGWLRNVVKGITGQLAQAGLHEQTVQHPAICFLDITGYTRLTQERGDAAAAELADELASLVQRTSIQRSGRPIKWLGDGVMFYFDRASDAVFAAIEMVEGVAGAGLPPAHVGIHMGPVTFQKGDYFGQTVNLASRIAEFARPGEILVTEAIVDANTRDDVSFIEIGAVELKGVSGAVQLFSAHKAA